MKILKSLIIWICFIPAAILNGGLREYILAPAFGQKWALPASGIILSGLIPDYVAYVSTTDKKQYPYGKMAYRHSMDVADRYF